MDNRRRKSIRLKGYDYSQNGAYFITICTEGRQNLLSEIVGADDPVRPNYINLSTIGNIVQDSWEAINEIYLNVIADKFVIMPNHVHGIIIINSSDMRKDTTQNRFISPGGQRRPPLQKIVQGFKSVTTRRCFPLGYKSIWQRSYYDHIIRNEKEYLKVWEYINDNPAKWQEDIYYNE